MKFRTVILSGAVALALPLLASAQAPGSIESDLNYAREYMEAGNPSAAATYFRQAVMKSPNHAEANLLLADALHKAGRAAEARPFLDKAISLSPALAARPEAVAILGAAPASGPSPAPAPVGAAAGSVAREDAPIGSASYLLQYAVGFMREGNFTAAADYANQALAVEPGNAHARSIIADAKARRAPADAPAAVRAPDGDPNQIGTPAYLLKYARYHMDNKAYASAVEYARQVLAIDPANAEAKRILADAQGKADVGAHPAGSCEAIYSSCWSGAMTYTPGSGYSADNLRRQQCMVERNICQGAGR